MTDTIFYAVPTGAYDILQAALGEGGLPNADLDGPDRQFFGLSDERGLIGYIGLEGDGPDRLLRSLEAVMDLREGLIHPLLDEHLPQAVSV